MSPYWNESRSGMCPWQRVPFPARQNNKNALKPLNGLRSSRRRPMDNYTGCPRAHLYNRVKVY
eukprot:4968643-Pyramimonas_sp.AAC.1